MFFNTKCCRYLTDPFIEHSQPVSIETLNIGEIFEQNIEHNRNEQLCYRCKQPFDVQCKIVSLDCACSVLPIFHDYCARYIHFETEIFQRQSECPQCRQPLRYYEPNE